MDPFEELERMAVNATLDSQLGEDEPSRDDITRWQRLFSYEYGEAKEKIKKHRSDLARERISEDLWALLRPQFEGYDREAYEHKLTLISPLSISRVRSDQKLLQVSETHASFLFRMEGPLKQANAVWKALGSYLAPQFKHGWGEDGEASFCRVNSAGKAAIEQWLSQQKSNHRPIFVRESMARKDLSETSIYPFLGIDATLPQHRLTTLNSTPEPRQNQYPVWYFFYGTLADNSMLAHQLQLPEQDIPILCPASVDYGILKSWAGKYKALIDGPSNSIIQGWAYEVQTAEHEEALRFYETAKYEVVRCSIELPDRKDAVVGLTFRFFDPSQLS
ncbi:MAG: hypothetical protein Q9167_000944 [Letrouitia subvulpina]